MTQTRPRLLSTTALLATAFLLTAPASAEPIHHWQFEASPGFLADSVGAATLTDAGATQATIPATGRGAEFLGIPPGNAMAADVGAGGERLTVVLGDAPAGDLTIELLVHFDALVGRFGAHLAGTAESALNNTIGWSLEHRINTGTLQLVVCLLSSCELIDSGLSLAIGTDYYVAVAFDVQDGSGGEATFYLQNLTDGGDLQTVTVSHSSPSYNAISTFAIGASASGALDSDVLLDEVRLSDTVLSESELLIAPPVEGCPAAPRAVCRPLAKKDGSKIGLAKDGKLTWQWKKGSATDKSDFGNPAGGEDPTNYFLCIYDEDAGEPSLVAAFDIPGGDGWKKQKTNKSKGFKLKRGGAGIGKAIFKPGADKKAQIVDLKGKKLDMPEFPLSQDPRVVVQLIHDEGGCWETEHSAPAKQNKKKGFLDKAD